MSSTVLELLVLRQQGLQAALKEERTRNARDVEHDHLILAERVLYDCDVGRVEAERVVVPREGVRRPEGAR